MQGSCVECPWCHSLNEFETKDNKISCIKCGTIVEERRSHFLPTIVERTESRPLYAYTSDFPEVFERKPEDVFQAERLVTAYSVLETDRYVLYSSSSSSLPGQMAELQKFVREFAKALRNSKNNEEALAHKQIVPNAIINENANMFLDPPTTHLNVPLMHSELSNTSSNIISNTNSSMGSGSNSLMNSHSNLSSPAAVQHKRIKDLIGGYFVIEKLVAKLGLDIEISKKSKELLKLHIASSMSDKKAKNIASMAGALVYELSKKTRPLGLDKVTEITTGKKKHFHIYLKEAQTLILAHDKEIPHANVATTEQTPTTANNVPPAQSASTAVAHIQRIGKLLKLNDSTIELAVEISLRIDNYANITRNNPVSIAAAVIYIACNLSGEKRTQTEIATHAGRAEATLRGTLKDLKPHFDQIIPKEHKNSLGALQKAETDTKDEKKIASASNSNSATPSKPTNQQQPSKQAPPTPGASKPTPQISARKNKSPPLIIHSAPISSPASTPQPNILPKPVLSPVKVLQPGHQTGANTTVLVQPASVALPVHMRSPIKGVLPVTGVPVMGLVVNNNAVNHSLGPATINTAGLNHLLPLPNIGVLTTPFQSNTNTPAQSPNAPRTPGMVTNEPQLQAAFHLLQQLSPTSKPRGTNSSVVGSHLSPGLAPNPLQSPFTTINTAARVLPPKSSEGTPIANNNNLVASSSAHKRKADTPSVESPPKKQKS